MAKDMTEDFALVFTPGSIISCITCFDTKYEGEVVAFDYDRRLLIIKSQSPVNPNHHNVHVLNLNFVRDKTIEIKKEVKKESVPQNNSHINTAKVSLQVNLTCVFVNDAPFTPLLLLLPFIDSRYSWW